MWRIVDSISMRIVVSSEGQSPSKFLIKGLRLARLLELDGNWTRSLDTRRMSFEIALACNFYLLGNTQLLNFVELSVTIISLGEKCAEQSLGPVFPVVSGVLHFRRIHQRLSLLGSDGKTKRTLSVLSQMKHFAGAIIAMLWVSAKCNSDIKEGVSDA